MVEGKVLVELKALTHIEDVHWAQVLNYLKAYRLVENNFDLTTILPVGILVLEVQYDHDPCAVVQ